MIRFLKWALLVVVVVVFCALGAFLYFIPPFFTTAHFDGHPSVLLRGARVGELTHQELAEVVQDAWLSRASATRARRWLAERGIE